MATNLYLGLGQRQSYDMPISLGVASYDVRLSRIVDIGLNVYALKVITSTGVSNVIAVGESIDAVETMVKATISNQIAAKQNVDMSAVKTVQIENVISSESFMSNIVDFTIENKIGSGVTCEITITRLRKLNDMDSLLLSNFDSASIDDVDYIEL